LVRGEIMIRQEGVCSRHLIEVLLVIFAILCLVPFWYVITISFSDPNRVREGQVILYPKGFNLKAYNIILSEKTFFNSFLISVERTIIGSALAITVQSMFAFGLSRKKLVGRKFFRSLVIFAVLFNGGIIPTYLVVCYTHLFNTIWALVVPIAFSPWNVIILASFFQSLPSSLEESATIDGANDFQVFINIAIPLSKASLATILLFVAVGHWNSLMDAIIYINSSKLKPLQSYLVDMVMRAQMQEAFADTASQDIPTLSIQTAAIFASTLPILVVYPFVQKYFIKGVMIGAIKG